MHLLESFLVSWASSFQIKGSAEVLQAALAEMQRDSILRNVYRYSVFIENRHRLFHL